MSRRVTKKNTEEAIDIETFKAWLQGVEDMQDAGWVPSAEQWKKIRAKINMIVVELEPLPAYGVQPAYGPQAPIFAPPMYNGQQPRGSALQVEKPRIGPTGALPGFQAPNAGADGSGILVGNQQDNEAPGEYASSFA